MFVHLVVMFSLWLLEAMLKAVEAMTVTRCQLLWMALSFGVCVAMIVCAFALHWRSVPKRQRRKWEKPLVNRPAPGTADLPNWARRSPVLQESVMSSCIDDVTFDLSDGEVAFPPFYCQQVEEPSSFMPNDTERKRRRWVKSVVNRPASETACLPKWASRSPVPWEVTSSMFGDTTFDCSESELNFSHFSDEEIERTKVRTPDNSVFADLDSLTPKKFAEQLQFANFPHQNEESFTVRRKQGGKVSGGEELFTRTSTPNGPGPQKRGRAMWNASTRCRKVLTPVPTRTSLLRAEKIRTRLGVSMM